jgi:hypothetical protein
MDSWETHFRLCEDKWVAAFFAVASVEEGLFLWQLLGGRGRIC